MFHIKANTNSGAGRQWRALDIVGCRPGQKQRGPPIQDHGEILGAQSQRSTHHEHGTYTPANCCATQPYSRREELRDDCCGNLTENLDRLWYEDDCSPKPKAGRTYEKKNAELTQSKRTPVGSPWRMSLGKPCKRALPRFVLSRSAHQDMNAVLLPRRDRVLTCKEVHDASYGHDTHVQFPH